jgi:DNA-binding response OmpR family regulator
MKKILIVDDEVDICDFVKNFFEERKFRAFTALSGEEALRILKKETPDLILLDLKMRKMNGIETLKGIRKINKNVDVIMVTAVDDQDKIKACSKLGACRYVTKPLVLEELEKIVSEQIKKDKNE